MTKEKIGGNGGKLTVTKTQTGKIYFENNMYGMQCFIHPDDIREYLKYPHRSRWSDRSHSNSVDDKDRECIIQYLRIKYLCKYQTVDELMKSRSKYKKKYLMQFTFDELQEYISKNKNEDKHEVKSGC